ncbi:MAG: exo-alpha-sialidase [Phycisphaera sp.]|nr:exo-alpha-sialidase [Phycisphaera sp.]
MALLHTITCLILLAGTNWTSNRIDDPHPAGLRFSAGVGVEVDADGRVTRWRDQGFGGRDLVAASEGWPGPTLGAMNDRACLEFDGRSRLVDEGDLGTLDGPRTVVAVVRADVANGGYVLDGRHATNRTALFTGQSAAPGVWTGYAGGQPTVVAEVVTPEAAVVLAMILDGNRQELRVNGRPSTGPSPTLPVLDGLVVGSRFNGVLGFQGGIAELLVFDRGLEEAELSLLEESLMNRYDVQDPPPSPSSTVVFEVGVDGYPNIRIPSILQLADQTLLAFAEAREGGDHARNDIVLKRSDDGGATWGPMQLIDDQGGDSLNDPLPVEVRFGPHAGRVYLTYMSFPEGCHTDCVETGYGPRSSHNWLTWSDDGGSTWSKPIDVTKTFRREGTNYAGSPGVGIQLERGPHRGRLVFPQREGPIDDMKAYTVHSDDGGVTWKRGSIARNPPGGFSADELAIVELEDGSILMNCRIHNGGPRRRLTGRSVDGGETFGSLKVDEGLLSPHCMGSIIRLDSDDAESDRERVLYCGPWQEQGRARGSVVVSADGGRTWGPPRLLVPGGFAYSQLVVLEPRGDVGLFYEADGYQTMRFLRFDPTKTGEAATSN